MKNNLISKIHAAVEDFYLQKENKFIPGKTFIPTGFAIYDNQEVNAVIDSLLSEHLGLSIIGKNFENQFAKYIGMNNCTLVNSGSSASLLALAGLKKKNNLRGGEIITPACGFPTTINPIIQLGFTPVFTDVDNTYNISLKSIEKALTNNTIGIVFAHTLGNPAKIDEIMQIAKREKIFVIEDCSDAYGSFCDGKKCGSFGDVSITSFYPAHNITLAGEGGAILTNDDKLNKIIRSLRDWGRDCHCEAGQDNACGKRFKHKLNNILYDHKYIFSNIGYNLKPIESQAAFGIEQLKRIEPFNIKRRENFINFKKEFKKFNKYLEFPKINDKASPAFFGLPLMIKNNDVNRNDLVRFLNKNKIGTRYLFGGNLIHQQAYKNIEYKICEKLTNTNKILKNLFWIGIHPNIGVEEIKYISSKFAEYFSKK